MTDFEVQQHLKDHLFHGVCKYICNSIWYLYSTPRTSYLQQMVTAHKMEAGIMKSGKKVRARAMVTTGLGKGTAEFGQQIAKPWLP